MTKNKNKATEKIAVKRIELDKDTIADLETDDGDADRIKGGVNKSINYSAL